MGTKPVKIHRMLQTQVLYLRTPRLAAWTESIAGFTRKLLVWVAVCLCAGALPWAASAEELPRISPSQLPGSLQELYAREQPNLGPYGHCAAGFDSRTDGLKMALSCSIYVRSSAQGARLAVKLCNERADFLKIKARCSLIVD